ncbi:MAG: galactose-1-phosphate uridylyltransferase [Chloroflexota bacterium]|nr:galactose-1-phosphate uridylyltransferase [Chloroflexota bacterium]
MSELRQDATTMEWVIIAHERAKRPHALSSEKEKVHLSSRDDSCPFCPGNEDRTPPEVMRLPIKSQNPDSQWDVRVVPNAYAALSLNGHRITRKKEGDLFRKMDGVGIHEVIIESPLHNDVISLMEVPQVQMILYAYRARYNEINSHPLVQHTLIFKNHGKGAGTSLVHPHTQITGTPIAPPYIRRKSQMATYYYDNSGKCLYCSILRSELRAKKRIVIDSDHFVVFHPFASYSAYETWILPKHHQSSFGMITDHQLNELAIVLRDTLRGLYEVLDNPAFNYMISSSPREDWQNSYYDWHLRIVPRISFIAGFEMGSGMYINTARPEDTAEVMRNHFNH